MRIAREARLASGEDDAMQTNPSQKSSKSARAYAKTYRIGPPLVPAIVTSRLTEYISRISLRKKQIFILSVCKYWSLKREARRGAPLLKRLHLEVRCCAVKMNVTDYSLIAMDCFLHQQTTI